MSDLPIVVEGLHRSFGGVHAVRGVDLRLEPGERRVIIGPNGAGKTTFFNLIAGQLRPTAGHIRLFGTDVTRLAADQRARRGLSRTFQITDLFPYLTVRESVILGTMARTPLRFAFWLPLARLKEPLAQADAALAAWDMSRWADVPVRELPYGEQRRLEIVLALATKPRVLLLDEPTAGLAAADAMNVAATIEQFPRDLAVIIIEHDMDIAFRLADRITVMYEGRVLVEGSVEEIRRNPQVKAIYLGTGDVDVA